ncbi:MAG: hypothetical protein RL748_3823, partial [Pseudomonadota bacterium]
MNLPGTIAPAYLAKHAAENAAHHAENNLASDASKPAPLQELLAQCSARQISLQVVDGNLKVGGAQGALEPALIAALRQQKSALIDWLQQKQQASAAASVRPIQAQKQSRAPLSLAQQRFWLAEQQQGPTAQFTLAFALPLQHQPDPARLERCLQSLLQRHHSLRTVYRQEADGTPFQQVLAQVPPVLVIKPCRDAQDCAEQIRQQVARPFDLGQDLMLRVTLLTLPPDQNTSTATSSGSSSSSSSTSCTLLFCLHHIAADGWSIGLLTDELSRLYQSGHTPLPALPLQYSDYALWQQQNPPAAPSLAYWRKQLADLPALHALPLCQPRPPRASLRAGSVHSLIHADTSTALQHWCQLHDATLFMGLHALLAALLQRYSHAPELVIASPSANRRIETSQIVGCFINPLVLRHRLNPQHSLNQILGQCRATILAAQQHQDLAFEHLLQQLRPQRSSSHAPLFQIMLILQNNDYPAIELDGQRAQVISIENGFTPYDLTLEVAQPGPGQPMALHWQYAQDLFRPAFMEQLAGHFETLLQYAIQQPTLALGQIDLLSPQQRQSGLHDWNPGPAPALVHTSLLDWINRHCQSAPEAIALIDGSQQISYRQLDRTARQLAQALRTQGLVPGSVLGICLPRQSNWVAALLACLHCAAIYLPLDPDYPAQRLAWMLEDANAAWIVSDAASRGSLPASHQARVIGIDALSRTFSGADQLAAQFADQHAARPAEPAEPAAPLYLIYTSGSSGRPKGVLGTRISLLQRLQWLAQTWPAQADEVFCQKTSIGFVDHVAEVFQALTSQRPLLLLPPDTLRNPQQLVLALQQHRVSRITLVPSLLKVLHDSAALPALSALRLIISSGEPLPPALAQAVCQALPHATLLNLYGSTECGADVSFYACQGQLATGHAACAFVPLGKPLAHCQIYLLDPQGQPVPPGVVGEIHVAGLALAQGYLNQPALSAEKFIPDPFASQPGGRLYRTGDLARMLPDGQLEYLGRADRQIKIRGCRVEPGETAAVLARQPAVADCTVQAHQRDDGSARLLAWVVPHTLPTQPKQEADLTATLRQALQAELPDYLLPAHIMLLTRLPLNPNGKLDRAALPLPENNPASNNSNTGQPANALEHTLCTIWQQVLGLASISVDDDMFQLGADSLNVIHLVRQLQQFGYQASFALLVQYPSIKALARVLAQYRVENQTLAPDGTPAGRALSLAAPTRLPMIPSRPNVFRMVPSIANAAQPAHDKQNPPEKCSIVSPIALPTPSPIHHWNVIEALRLERNRFDPALLRQALALCLQYHDGLRLRWQQRADGSWQENLLPQWDELPFAVQDARQHAARAVAYGREVLIEMQQQIRLDTRPMQLTLLDFGAGQDWILLLTLHHLLVDGLSLSIFWQDLSTLYQQLAQNQPAQLPPVPCSFARYARALQAYADSTTVQTQ